MKEQRHFSLILRTWVQYLNIYLIQISTFIPSLGTWGIKNNPEIQFSIRSDTVWSPTEQVSQRDEGQVSWVNKLHLWDGLHEWLIHQSIQSGARNELLLQSYWSDLTRVFFVEVALFHWMLLCDVARRTGHLLLRHVIVAGNVQRGLLTHPRHPETSNVQGQGPWGNGKFVGGFADEEIGWFEKVGGVYLGAGTGGYHCVANHAVGRALGMHWFLVVDQVVSIVH